MTELPALDQLARLHNFGRSIHSPAYVYRPTHAEEMARLFELARRSGFSVAPRGAGRSYGDASLNAGNVVLDLRRMNRILEWNPDTGVIRVEPGVTIQQLWQYTLEDGWWPPVVPGTMFPTLGGCLAMNIHGKNNFHAGTLGEHVLEFTALLPTGEAIICTPTQNADFFYALIGGVGVLGVFTSITLQMKALHSGDVRVEAWAAPDLREMIAEMDRLRVESDYIVGWVDGTAFGRGLGRGQIHRANYLAEGEDPQPQRTLQPDYQMLSDSLLGLMPKSSLWRFMRPFMNNPGVNLINTGKYLAACLFSHHQRYRQSLVAFNFLLDYIPEWERAYGRGGLIQYQSFIPTAAASEAFGAMLKLTQRRGLPSYLGVLKRHRPDAFLLTHAVDGFSLALDFRVTRRNRRALQQLANELNRLVLDAGGRFYFAKDSTLTPHAAAEYLGAETLARFRALKARCDPHSILQTELYRRVFEAEAGP